MGNACYERDKKPAQDNTPLRLYQILENEDRLKKVRATIARDFERVIANSQERVGEKDYLNVSFAAYADNGLNKPDKTEEIKSHWEGVQRKTLQAFEKKTSDKPEEQKKIQEQQKQILEEYVDSVVSQLREVAERQKAEDASKATVKKEEVKEIQTTK